MKREQLHLGVGEKLLINFPGETDNIKTELIGYSNNNFLIILSPLIPGIRQKVLENREITVRYFSEGTVYGFRSSLITYLSKPEPILFISYPTNVEIMELRKNRRINCNIPAKIYHQDQDYQGLILDISIQGCRIFIDGLKKSEINKFEQDTPIYLVLSMLAEKDNVQIKGIIKNVNNQQNSLFLGIQFDSQSESLKPVSDYLEYAECLLAHVQGDKI